MMNTMPFKYIIFFLILINCYSYASAEEVVVFPDPMILDYRVEDVKLIMKNQATDKRMIYPLQIIIDLKGDKISGILVRYDSAVKFDQVENALNKFYGLYSIWSASKDVSVRHWKIAPEKLLISLGFDDENKVQIAFIRIVEKSHN